jgi:predicted flap endonuclease-1-like 5' DNA nuclease
METILILALLAVAVILGIFWAASLKRRRVAGAMQPGANRETADLGLPESTMKPPVAPAPPPLADEPLVAAAPFDASPATLAADLAPEPAAPPAPPEAPAPAAMAASGLTQLKGLGPKLAATLAELGFTRIDQIAVLTPDAAADLDSRLGAFQGRMARDRWIEQAKLLSAGDKAGYEAEFGKLG